MEKLASTGHGASSLTESRPEETNAPCLSERIPFMVWFSRELTSGRELLACLLEADAWAVQAREELWGGETWRGRGRERRAAQPEMFEAENGFNLLAGQS